MIRTHIRYAVCTLFALAWTVAFGQDGADEAAMDGDSESESVVEEEISMGTPPPEPACFNVRDIDNFDAIGDSFVYVQGRRNQHYLLTMTRSCFGLRSANGIAISNVTNRVCSGNFSEITYRHFETVETCTIREVEEVADKAAADAIAERRRDQN